jgi:hypothetical protein
MSDEENKKGRANNPWDRSRGSGPKSITAALLKLEAKE